MQRLILTLIITAFLLISVTGCDGGGVEPPPGDGQEVASTCVACHTNEDTLQAVASPEEAEAVSEATSGEG